jgi:hypothetical protein
VPGVGAVGLGALLVAAPRRGLRRLGEMRFSPDRVQLSTTNRQPVVASNAASSGWPAKRFRNFRTSARCAGEIRARPIYRCRCRSSRP